MKLVRDRVGQFVGAGSRVRYGRIPDGEEYVQALRAKLIEECGEYLADPSVGELADILEVLKALAVCDVREGWLAVEEECDAKLRERGGFKEGVGMFVTTTAPARHEREHAA